MIRARLIFLLACAAAAAAHEHGLREGRKLAATDKLEYGLRMYGLGCQAALDELTADDKPTLPGLADFRLDQIDAARTRRQ